MKLLLRATLASILALTVSGCSLDKLANIEPTKWERQQFEREMMQSLRRAANTPGIDNGSTIIVTSKGDTLVSPTDSTLAASQIRTVYVDLRPQYPPHAISGKVVDMVGIFSAIGVIAAMILLILLGVFVVVIRRQHGRNKLIARAITDGYQLPEAFFTGVPSPAQVTVVNEAAPSASCTAHGPQAEAIPESPASFTTDVPPCPPPMPDPAFIRKMAGGNDTKRIKDLTNGLIMIGLGLVLFLAFAAGSHPEVGLFSGGILVVFGGAKLLTLYLSKKL